MLELLKGFSFIDYCQDRAYLSTGQATNYFSEMPAEASNAEVAPGLIVRVTHYQLPPVRPNTLYIVPLHVFMDLEAHSDRIDYITPVREKFSGTEVVYESFRISAKKRDMIVLLEDAVGQGLLLETGAFWRDFESDEYRPAPLLNTSISQNIDFYVLFLNKGE